MSKIMEEVRDLNRFNHILLVLIEEGFGFLVQKANLGGTLSFSKKIKSRFKPGGSLKTEERLRRTLERLGPTFIKFGQVLSLRPDLLPLSYTKELEKLLDNVNPISFNEVKSIIESELKQPLHKVFSDFDRKPIASASISQVHKATLRTGEKVAVKVQRPNIRKVMSTDIDIMFHIAELLEKHVERAREYKPVSIIREFREWTEKEIDFRLEARNVKRFYSNFAGSRTVKIPKLYEQWTTEKILVLEFIEGIELNNLGEIAKRGIDFNKVVQNGLDAILTMVFVHGFFHADPHPGNIIITKDGKVAFVDFGIVGFFDERLKNKSIDLLYGIVEGQPDIIVETLLSMGFETKKVDMEAFRMDISEVITPLQSGSIKDIKLSKVLEEVISVPLKHKLKIPASFVLFGKTIITLEGVALEYNPDFKIAEAAKPFVEKIIMKRSNPINAFRNFVHNISRYKRIADDLPEKAERILERLEKGSIKIDIEDTDIKKLALEIDRSSSRITYGLIIAALLLTSAITIQFARGPSFFGIPILPMSSLVFALLLSFALFSSIVKEKTMMYKR